MTVIQHPLVLHNLTRLRNQRTGPQEFRRVLSEVAALMLYEATRSFETLPLSVVTPLARARGLKLRREVLLVPVLRAGLGMLDSILQLIPQCPRRFHRLEARGEKSAGPFLSPEPAPGFAPVRGDPD